MAKEFINPNWHVLLIHFPLGVFVLGMLIELLSFVYRRTTLRAAGRWMILIGALSSIPTALSGIYALGNVARMDLPASVANADQPWQVIVENSALNKDQWEHLRQHVFSNGLATAVCAVLATLGLGLTDRWRRTLYIPIVLGLLFGLVAMVYGAWHGGEMVYRHGTAVLRVEHQGATADASQPKPAESATDEQAEVKRGVEYYVPPIQLHVVLAGVAVAFALAALGLSMRAIASTPDEDYTTKDLDEFGLERLRDRDPMLEPPKPGSAGALDVARSLNPDADVDSRGRRLGLPVSRTWLIASFIAVAAALVGVWFLAGPDELLKLQPRKLWSTIVASPRRLWHVMTGGVIVVVPLVLALVTRVSRRPKVLLSLLSLVLLGAVALQVWLGVLLMLDTPRGTITRFNRSGESTAPSITPTTEPATQAVASRR